MSRRLESNVVLRRCCGALWAIGSTFAAGAWAQESAAPAAAPAETSAAEPAATAPAPAPAAPASTWPDPVDSPAQVMPLAARALILDIAETATRAIAVGERGTVLWSDDRVTWTQVADMPTRSTLTAVTVLGDKVWAVGRDGVIVHSSDAGMHWTLQRKDPFVPAKEDLSDNGQHGAPLLDVLFLDDTHGIAIGAYSLYLETSDGGSTWTQRSILQPAAASADAGANDGDAVEEDRQTFSREELKIADETEPHFNAIARTSVGSLLIAGERGSLLRSRDGGVQWQRLKLPYDGSMFGALGYEGEHAIVFGLRGHAFETDDLGDTWKELKTDTELSLMGGTKLPNGGAALVGANGLVLLRRSATEQFKSGTVVPSGALAAVLPVEGGAAFVVGGENGIGRYEPK
jgi:photosystem II stability/assembly factor-like uncharacterized protein